MSLDTLGELELLRRSFDQKVASGMLPVEMAAIGPSDRITQVLSSKFTASLRAQGVTCRSDVII